MDKNNMMVKRGTSINAGSEIQDKLKELKRTRDKVTEYKNLNFFLKKLRRKYISNSNRGNGNDAEGRFVRKKSTNEYKRSLNEVEENINELEKELGYKDETIKKLLGEVEKLQKEVDGLRNGDAGAGKENNFDEARTQNLKIKSDEIKRLRMRLVEESRKLEKMDKRNKRLSENLDLVNIEKEQYYKEAKELQVDCQKLKDIVKNSEASLRMLRNSYIDKKKIYEKLCLKLEKSLVDLPPTGQLMNLRDKVLELNNQNKKLKKQVEELTEILKKTDTSDLREKQSKDSTIDEIKNLLNIGLNNITSFNSSFLTELMNEFYKLEHDYDVLKSEKEVQARRMEYDIVEKEQEISMLRKDVIALRNNAQTCIIDDHRKFSIDKSPSKATFKSAITSIENSIYLGKSPKPRDGFDDTDILREDDKSRKRLKTGKDSTPKFTELKEPLIKRSADKDKLTNFSLLNSSSLMGVKSGYPLTTDKKLRRFTFREAN